MKYTKTNFRLLTTLFICILVAILFAICIIFDLNDRGVRGVFFIGFGAAFGIYSYYKVIFIKNGANMSAKPSDLMDHKSKSYEVSETFPINSLHIDNIVVFNDNTECKFQRKDAIGEYWFKPLYNGKSFSIKETELLNNAVKLVGSKGIRWEKI